LLKTRLLQVLVCKVAERERGGLESQRAPGAGLLLRGRKRGRERKREREGEREREPARETIMNTNTSAMYAPPL